MAFISHFNSNKILTFQNSNTLKLLFLCNYNKYPNITVKCTLRKKKVLFFDRKIWNVKNVFKPEEDPNVDWLKRCGRVWESWKKKEKNDLEIFCTLLMIPIIFFILTTFCAQYCSFLILKKYSKTRLLQR